MGIIIFLIFSLGLLFIARFIYSNREGWSSNRHIRLMNKLERQERKQNLAINYQTFLMQERAAKHGQQLQDTQLLLEFEKLRQCVTSAAIEKNNTVALEKIKVLNSLMEGEIFRIRMLSDEAQRIEMNKLLTRSTDNLHNITQRMANGLDGTF